MLTNEFGAKSSERIKSNKEGNLDGSGDVAQGMLTYSPSAPNNCGIFEGTIFADPLSLSFEIVRPLDLDLAVSGALKRNICTVFHGYYRNNNAVVVAGLKTKIRHLKLMVSTMEIAR